MQDGVLTSGRSAMGNHKCQLITRYILLDHISDAHGGPTAIVPKPRVQHEAHILQRLEPTVKNLMSWHVAARNIRTHIDRMKDAPDEPLFDLPVPDCLTIDQERYLQNMTLLSRAQTNYRKSTYAIAEGHMQLLAFMVLWHATVCVFPLVSFIHYMH